MHRDAQVAIIFGRNGTGKSTFVQKLVKKISSRALVVTFAGLPKIWRQYKTIDVADASAFKWKKGIRQAQWVRHEEDTAKYIYKNFRSGIVIFDDCREYIPDRINQNPWLKRLLSSFRHKEIDLFFIAHSPSDIPPQIWMYNSAVFVGSTDALLPNRIKIGSAPRILEAQKRVNQKFLAAEAKKNGSHYGIFELVRP